MKAVFLDRNTFSETLDLPTPEGVSEWIVHASSQPEDVVKRLQDADIALVNKVVLSETHLQQLPKLRLIQITATGTDNVDVKAAEALGIAVKNVAGYSVQSVSEHTLMMILAVFRASKSYHQQIADGYWHKDGRPCVVDPPLIDLAGKTLGIIGYGKIGQRVKRLAEAFAIKVLIAEHPGKTPRNSNYLPFETVLKESEIISLHCPLTEQTRHMINAQTITQMTRKPLLVNMARGAVVDDQAVTEAVLRGDLFGYACDVFSQEPLPESNPLMAIVDHPRVLFTPHNAWGSQYAQQLLWEILCKQVSEFIQEK